MLDKRTIIKAIVSTVCLIISIVALYVFVAVVDVSSGWQIVLALIAIGWIVSGILSLMECFRKDKQKH